MIGLFAAAVVCFILAKLIGKGEKKLQSGQVRQAESQFTPEQLKFLKTPGSLFTTNQAMPLHEIYERCGIPHDVVVSRDSALIRSHIPFEKDSDGYNVFMTYSLAVNKRDMLAKDALMVHPNDVLNLNLHSKENIYHVIYGVVLYQEKTTVTNVAYSGSRWTSGPLCSGTLSVVANELTRFMPMDSGHLVFTNERLIFIGKQKNVSKQVKIADILYNTLYQDGVLVHIPNRKPLLFKFPEHKDFEIFEVSDGINEFVIVYDRIANGTYDKDLNANKAPVATRDALTTQKLGELLKAKNYDPQIADMLSLAEIGENVSTSAIQRKYLIGYAKAGRLVDQMEALQFVTAFRNGKRQWLVDASDGDLLTSLVESAAPYPLDAIEP